jgi:hypothetical protein
VLREVLAGNGELFLELPVLTVQCSLPAGCFLKLVIKRLVPVLGSAKALGNPIDIERFGRSGIVLRGGVEAACEGRKDNQVL